MKALTTKVLLAAALLAPLAMTGCEGHGRVYVWGPGETTYYARWEGETHRDHVEWAQRNAADQRAYWAWRRHHQ